MPIRNGDINFNKMFNGSARIIKVFDGSSLVFSEGGLIKFTDAPITGYLSVDNDYIYVVKGYVSGVNDPVVYKIDKRTKKATKIIEIASDYEYVSTESNDSLVLIALDGGKKYVWYNKETDTCSEVFDLFEEIITTGTYKVYGCVIDANYTYFMLSELEENDGIKNIAKVENGKTFGYSYPLDGYFLPYYSFIDDDDRIYLFTNEGQCFVFDKTTNMESILSNRPYDDDPTQPAVSEVIPPYTSKGNTICQNNTYIFQICKDSEGKNNRILVTNKTQLPSKGNGFLTVPITELEDIAGMPTVACTDKHLFVCYGPKIYVFYADSTDTYNTPSFDAYAVVDVSKFVDNITSAVGDSVKQCLYIRAGSDIFRYTVPHDIQTASPLPDEGGDDGPSAEPF